MLRPDLERKGVSNTIVSRSKVVRAKELWCKQLNKIENCLADSTNPAQLQSERMCLETKMDILIGAQERLDEVLDDFEVKRVAQQKFEIWEQE